MCVRMRAGGVSCCVSLDITYSKVEAIKKERSAVQHRFLTTSQIKNLQREGAHVFQIRCHGPNLMDPKKKHHKQICLSEIGVKHADQECHVGLYCPLDITSVNNQPGLSPSMYLLYLLPKINH